jgi:hypothetical protein
MSLAEIEEAVRTLSREDFAKLAAYMAREDKLAWDDELEATFRPAASTRLPWKGSTRK